MPLTEQLSRLAAGLAVSIQLTVISVVCGFALGLVFALITASPNRIVRWCAVLVVEIGRGIPALVVLYLVYFGMPSIHVLLDSFPAAAVALTLTVSAYSSEMIRGGISSVPRGQWEASSALGMRRSTILFRIVLPQALKSATPALMNLAVQSFQATSLAYAISVTELMSQGYQITMVTFEYMRTYALTGLVYALIAVPAIWLSRGVERRLMRGSA